MKIKISQLKTLIENFVNESPRSRPGRKSRRQSRSIGLKMQGEENQKNKTAFIKNIRGDENDIGLLKIKKSSTNDFLRFVEDDLNIPGRFRKDFFNDDDQIKAIKNPPVAI